MKTKLLLFFLVATMVANAQDTPSELITDRPDQTESARVVPLKALQIETGLILENYDTEYITIKNTTYNTTLLRYGLMANFELRLGLSYLSQERTYTNPNYKVNESGLSPLYTGFKVELLEEKGWLPQLAFLGSLTLPATAAEAFKPDHVAPGMRFAFAHTLTEQLSLGYNLGAEWDGHSAAPYYFYSLVLGIGIGDHMGLFLETYGYKPEGEEIEPLIDAGFTFLLRNNLQFDISGGLGLKHSVPDNFLSVGVTYRMPR
ncbi:MAG: transporter [Bacteroidota bacterium]